VIIFSILSPEVALQEVVDLLLVDEVALELDRTGVGLLGNDSLHEPGPFHQLRKFVSLLFRLGLILHLCRLL